MRRIIVCGLVVLLFCSFSVVNAQVEERIQSGDSEILVTVWGSVSDTDHSLVLVPGWTGGPSDVLGLAEFLSAKRILVVVLTPRGWHSSEGISTFANALDDIGSAVAWTRSKFGREPSLGGHSWGGGLSLAYAARDTTVSRVFSLAGTDHGQFIRQYQKDSAFAGMVDQILAASSAPAGPIRFDVEFGLREMKEGQSIYGLIENADKFVGRSVLLVGGWKDQNVTVDHTLLPLYRALERGGVTDLSFFTYHDDHSFSTVRAELNSELLAWLLARPK